MMLQNININESENIIMNKPDKVAGLLRDMILFDLLFLLIGEIIIVVFLPNKQIYAMGLMAGVLLAIFTSILIKLTLSWSIHMAGKVAALVMIFSYMLRLGVIACVIVGLYYIGPGAAIAAFVGLFSLKLSAYIAPLRSKD